MSKSPRYRWQTRWHVDLDAGTATHDSGLTVRYVRDPWREKFIARPDDREAYLAQLAVKNGGHNAPIMLRRLLWEAIEMRDTAILKKERYGGPPP